MNSRRVIQRQGRRPPKERLYEELARVAKGLANPKRLELLEILAQGERTVDALARATGQPIANASHHLQALREAHLVEARKEGLYVHYRLVSADAFQLVTATRRLAEKHVAEVDRLTRAYFDSRDELEPVDRDELLGRVTAGMVIVLDVRPEEEYRAGHVPGAISVPLGRLAARLKTLPRSKEVVAYCRGPYCVMAYDAVAALRARGFRARRLVEGFPEWRAAGLPVHVGEAP